MKKWLVYIGLLFFSETILAQGLPWTKPLPDYPFAHFERNQLIYPGDSLDMERFFQKMDSVVFLGEGNVNIMHIGGSHVQAGMFTQQFRDNLLNISTDLMGGQNFVFPFSAGGTNNPSHFIVRSTGDWTYCRNAVHSCTRLRRCAWLVLRMGPKLMALFRAITHCSCMLVHEVGGSRS